MVVGFTVANVEPPSFERDIQKFPVVMIVWPFSASLGSGLARWAEGVAAPSSLYSRKNRGACASPLPAGSFGFRARAEYCLSSGVILPRSGPLLTRWGGSSLKGRLRSGVTAGFLPPSALFAPTVPLLRSFLPSAEISWPSGLFAPLGPHPDVKTTNATVISAMTILDLVMISTPSHLPGIWQFGSVFLLAILIDLVPFRPRRDSLRIRLLIEWPSEVRFDGGILSTLDALRFHLS